MKKLVAYITTGYPDKEFTIDLAYTLSQAGVDILELGIPFSDPVADGAVIEKANLKALERGFRVSDIFEVSNKIASEIDTLWMGYFNPFYHIGIDRFISEAKASGVSGFIIPDLPFEEAKPYKEIIKKESLALIDFIAPTDTEDRIAMISKDADKFIYLVAYAGITGSQKSEDLKGTIETIRRYSNTSIYVGFGVNEQTAKEKAKGVDGVIVGSAFIKILLDNNLSDSQKIAKISEMARVIKDKINE